MVREGQTRLHEEEDGKRDKRKHIPSHPISRLEKSDRGNITLNLAFDGMLPRKGNHP